MLVFGLKVSIECHLDRGKKSKKDIFFFSYKFLFWAGLQKKYYTFIQKRDLQIFKWEKFEL